MKHHLDTAGSKNFSSQSGRKTGSSNLTAFREPRNSGLLEKVMSHFTVDKEDPRVPSNLRTQANGAMKKGMAVAFVWTGRKIELFVEDVAKVWAYYVDGGDWKYYLPE